MKSSSFREFWCAMLLFGTLLRTGAALESEQISFNRQIRPILSENCFKCHGADEKARKAKFRLDTPTSLTQPAKSGERPIIPGRPDASELIKRISSTDPDEVMPPPSTKKMLTSVQKQLLRDWIAAGAKYEAHWAFVPPRVVSVPEVNRKDWAHNPIDHFVLARLEKEGLEPSPQTDRYTLVRRAYLDLIGLPPTTEQADDFVNDPSPDAFTSLVDRLLASPHYGERWARRWLDLARYADTNGYEKDRPRSIWPYRDWVIQALNDDMPFDWFTIKQLAGDMLPGATLSDRIATGFHRNTMLNEEGGIDPLEFRHYAVIDRVATTGVAWLGLTVGCAQCHTHKFDPITHREFYQLLAFFNNSDEQDISVPDPEMAAKRALQEAKIQEMETQLQNQFPVPDVQWEIPDVTIVTAGGSEASKLLDGSWRFAGQEEKDVYFFSFATERATQVSSIRLETLVDGEASSKAAGQSSSGNFVLTEFQVFISLPDEPDKTNALKLVRAKADFAQKEFPAAQAIDNDTKTGWAVDPQQRKDHWAIFELDQPRQFPEGTRWQIKLEQQYGTKHLIRRARVSLGRPIIDPRPIDARREELLQRSYTTWAKSETEKAINWTPLLPTAATSNVPNLSILNDNSVLASGDQTKSDTYDVKFTCQYRHVTALRLEALPHPSLPKNGPGRTYYEGPKGDFFLSELSVAIDGKPLIFKKATHDYAGNSMGDKRTAAELTYDHDATTGWSTTGGEGKPHAVVYLLSEPLDLIGELQLKMLFERHFSCGLGRFRLSVTSDDKTAEARGLPMELEAIFAKSPADRTDLEKKDLFQYFLSVAPELAQARQEIQKERDALPQFPTTLVFAERSREHPRATHIHNRGEYLQPTEEVAAGLPAFLPQLPAGVPQNRLSFARWLVSTNNPLTARVTVNRQWQAFFGKGLVRTLQDFGYQGSPPSHPELLDWLALEFMKSGWSIKQLHRLIVTSATYQQSSDFRSDLETRDPENIWLARGPRFRVEAEMLRDLALSESGMLSQKIGGPSVFPPQPTNVTTEGAYGPLTWKTSVGEDRYRRGLYTYAKRTAPFAMFNTFDGPTGEACIARREVSNTPLQSLALLNDVMILEVARSMGKTIALQSGDNDQKATTLFRRCVTRPPRSDERTMIVAFYQNQKQRFERKEMDAAKFADAKEEPVNEIAAWASVARALMNLDEAITKE